MTTNNGRDGLFVKVSVKDLSENNEWVEAVKSEICGVSFQNITNNIVNQAKDLINHLFA